jgi:hypothetical protein
MRDEFHKDAVIDEAIHGKRRCTVVMVKTHQIRVVDELTCLF